LGLAPVIVEQILPGQAMRDSGTTVILVEQSAVDRG
jgi:ABC-type branched-subunit amino acid transport system ATPase component